MQAHHEMPRLPRNRDAAANLPRRLQDDRAFGRAAEPDRCFPERALPGEAGSDEGQAAGRPPGGRRARAA